MRITVAPSASKRLKAGHPWVFANEVQEPPVRELPPGETVEIRDARGHFLGWGFANPRSLVAVRLLARNAKADPDGVGFYVARLREALELRHRACPEAASGRILHGAADALPGLHLDRYADLEHGSILTVDLGTPGLEQRAGLVQEALLKALQPQGAWLLGDTPTRQHEGLDADSGRWLGEVPEVLQFEENGMTCRASLPHGLHHDFAAAEDRRFAFARVAGRRVLDLHGGTGAWGVGALVHGASEAVVVDPRELALELAAATAEEHGVAEALMLAQGDPTEVLADLAESGERFDIVLCNPPPLATSRSALKAALPAYRALNEAAMRRLLAGGLLFTSSRSPHLSEDRFLAELVKAAKSAGRGLRLLHRGGQGPDHPVPPAFPESRTHLSLVLQVR